MALYITEYPGAAYVSGWRGPFPQDQGLGGAGSTVITTTVISSAAGASTFNLLPSTRLVRLQATANAWVLFSGQTSTAAMAAAVTSTNAALIVANVAPEFRGVVPGSRYSALST